MPNLIIAAPAKLNLFLHVTAKRSDGYHLLESLIVFTRFGDSLDISAADSISLEVTGPFAHALQGQEQNLVLKAARLLQAETGCTQGARITLSKHIPVSAGLGGGSSDAAAALKGLARLWGIPRDAKLQEIAQQLGSDVPVCMAARPAWVSGVGEVITPVDMDATVSVLLVNPNKPLATTEVFKAFSGAFALPHAQIESIGSFDALIETACACQNQLEAPAMAKLPVIREMLDAIANIPGCRLARMSGSGATCFGLFAQAQQAEQGAGLIRSRYPQWWCIASAI